MSQSSAQAYQVLARKYRPSDFTALIGQDAMVRTLANAMAAGRLAHAFVLTGVRGVGKTTTARIIAKGLNCETADGPTTEPCGTCGSCTAIAESRHVDVLEMDAASRTGVDDVREIIENVRYAPVSARFKVYIIDEVHMLSNNAFNALLKTLEEPPEHAKFIFATTEIRKVPVTVLSRCQRFDLRRVEGDVLTAHLRSILAAESASAEDEALAMITRAAEGSVRDSLSLLDQALAHGQGEITATQVRDMLGYADRGQVFDLLGEVMAGDIAAALGRLRTLYDRGSEPAVIVSDLMEITHALTRLKVAPDLGADALMSDDERTRAGEMAAGLAMPHLTRAWQMLMKGLGEVRAAPSPISAAEMVLIRLAYAADLPDPASLVKTLQNGGPAGTGGRPASSAPGGASTGGGSQASVQAVATATVSGAAPGGDASGAPTAQVIAFSRGGAAPAVEAEAELTPAPMPQSFEALVEVLTQNKEGVLAVALKDQARLVAYQPGHLEFSDEMQLKPEVHAELKTKLKQLTGRAWTISYSAGAADLSLKEQADAQEAADFEAALQNPLVKSVLAAFPGARLKQVKALKMDAPAADGDGMPGADDDAVGSFDFSDDEGK